MSILFSASVTAAIEAAAGAGKEVGEDKVFGDFFYFGGAADGKRLNAVQNWGELVPKWACSYRFVEGFFQCVFPDLTHSVTAHAGTEYVVIKLNFRHGEITLVRCFQRRAGGNPDSEGLTAIRFAPFVEYCFGMAAQNGSANKPGCGRAYGGYAFFAYGNLGTHFFGSHGDKAGGIKNLGYAHAVKDVYELAAVFNKGGQGKNDRLFPVESNTQSLALVIYAQRACGTSGEALTAAGAAALGQGDY